MVQTAVVPARPGERLRFGTVLFLSSELLFFAGLFAAYFTLRSETSLWPPLDVELDVGLSSVATLLLVASSVTYVAGLRAGRAGALGRMRRWLLATMALGAAFLAMQAWDWSRLDFRVSSHAYGTMFYAMTGFHGLHVLAGIVLMSIVLGRQARGAHRTGNVEGPEAVGYYWHFVDVVWIGLYATLFLLQ